MQYHTQHVIVKPCSITELSGLYGVSPKVMKRWLINIEMHTGSRSGRFYTIPQVCIIFSLLGVPQGIEAGIPPASRDDKR